MMIVSALAMACLACAAVVSAACPDLTPAELTKLFNKPIKSARFVGRKGNWSGVAGKGFHVGVEVTLPTNERWLIHHTDNNKPLVTCPSGNYDALANLPVRGKKTVGGARAAAGNDDWSLVTANCVIAGYKIAEYLGGGRSEL